jgi:hypothetical protein
MAPACDPSHGHCGQAMSPNKLHFFSFDADRSQVAVAGVEEALAEEEKVSDL